MHPECRRVCNVLDVRRPLQRHPVPPPHSRVTPHRRIMREIRFPFLGEFIICLWCHFGVMGGTEAAAAAATAAALICSLMPDFRGLIYLVTAAAVHKLYL